MSEECATCRYWKSSGTWLGRPVGKCRALPPSIAKVADDFGDAMSWHEFPQTGQDGWCGMFARQLRSKGPVF